MSDVPRKRRAPAGLGARGRKLWSSVAAGYVLTVAEEELLLEACRTADDAERLAAALAEEPAVVVGSAGQPRPHPLAKELRDTRQLLARLLGQLEIPADEVDGDRGNVWDGLSASARARKAAAARWNRAGA